MRMDPRPSEIQIPPSLIDDDEEEDAAVMQRPSKISKGLGRFDSTSARRAATRKPTKYDANWEPLDSDVKTLQEWQSIKREKERERAHRQSHKQEEAGGL
jgi:hypothetical protein